MRIVNMFVAIGVVGLVVASCRKDNSNPIDPLSTPQRVVTTDYTAKLDSTYFVQWSDGTWEKFYRSVAINGSHYRTVITSAGNEVYFDDKGRYSGIKQPGFSLTIFDTPAQALPDTMNIGDTFNKTVTFYGNGAYNSISWDYTLKDTVSVVSTIGLFNSCMWMTVKATATSGGNTQYINMVAWYAKSVGAIKQTSNAGVTITITGAVVGGRLWGMTSPPKNLMVENDELILNTVPAFIK